MKTLFEVSTTLAEDFVIDDWLHLDDFGMVRVVYVERFTNDTILMHVVQQKSINDEQPERIRLMFPDDVYITRFNQA